MMQALALTITDDENGSRLTIARCGLDLLKKIWSSRSMEPEATRQQTAHPLLLVAQVVWQLTLSCASCHTS